MESEQDVDKSRSVSAAAIVAILAITFVFSLLSRRMGTETLAGSLAAVGGIVLCLVVVWVTQRWLRLGWPEIGLRRPRSWPKTFGLGILVAVVTNAAILPILTYVIAPLSGDMPDVSRFDGTRGNLGVLVGTVLTVWLTSAFPEEVIWRGFLLTRLAKLAGGGRLAWGIALALSSVHFGLIHFYQGVSGVVVTGLSGFLYGLAFLICRRNLWVVIVAHAANHVMSFTAMYFGVV
ncbi:MAG: CPBP family intramembrane metalloprotease [Thermoanaerobaculia bacterium]|nr:CPBP family intramembrane metalloprotease [Thermoanaerobaculia bacterium]